VIRRWSRIEIVEEVKKGFTEEWKDWAPMGVGLLAIHKLGAHVEGKLREMGVWPEWVEPLTAFVFAGGFYAGAGIVPEEYKDLMRLMGTGAAAFGLLKSALVFWPGSKGNSPTKDKESSGQYL